MYSRCSPRTGFSPFIMAVLTGVAFYQARITTEMLLVSLLRMCYNHQEIVLEKYQGR